MCYSARLYPARRNLGRTLRAADADNPLASTNPSAMSSTTSSHSRPRKRTLTTQLSSSRRRIERSNALGGGLAKVGGSRSMDRATTDMALTAWANLIAWACMRLFSHMVGDH